MSTAGGGARRAGVDFRKIPLVKGWRAQRVPDTSGQAGVVSFSLPSHLAHLSTRMHVAIELDDGRGGHSERQRRIHS